MENSNKQSQSWLNAWIETQQNFFNQYKKWGESFQPGEPAGKETDGANSFFSSWTGSQNNMTDQFMKNVSSMQESFMKQMDPQNLSDFGKIFDRGILQQLIQFSLGGLPKPFDFGNFSFFPNGFDAQKNFMEGLLMNNSPFQMFGSASDSGEMFANFFSTFFGHLPELYGPWLELMKQISHQFTEMAHTGVMKEEVEKMILTEREKLGRLLNTPKFGIHREKLEKISVIIESYLDFVHNLFKFMKLISDTAREADQHITKVINSLAAEGKTPKSFQEMSRIWTSENEAIFLELMSSPEYVALQKEFSSSYFRLRNLSHKMVEDFLRETPVATKSEVDLAYKEIHGLKSEIRTLRRAIKELKSANKVSSVKPTVAKKTTTEKKKKSSPKKK